MKKCVLQTSLLSVLLFSAVNAAEKNANKEESVNCDELAGHIQRKFLQLPVKCFLSANSGLRVKFPCNYLSKGCIGEAERSCQGQYVSNEITMWSLEIQKYQTALNRCVSKSTVSVPTPKVMGLLTDLEQQKALMGKCVALRKQQEQEERRAQQEAEAQYQREKMKSESLDKFIDESGE